MVYYTNKIDLTEKKKFAAILGANPSEGARSPKLWNAAFKAHGIDSVMHPMDVNNDNLVNLLEVLDGDVDFIGGAIAVPHKESVASWLKQKGKEYITKEADSIGAVNTLFRTKSGHLCGTNTDGEGALESLKVVKNNIAGSNVLLIGPGGAGKAVAAYLAKEIGDTGTLTLSVRDKKRIEDFSTSINAKVISWPLQSEILKKFDIIVNCSILGSKQKGIINGEEVLMELYSPITGECDEFKYLSVLDSSAVLFDIIYDPMPTKLLKHASSIDLVSLDGGPMNLEQAVIAFGYAVNEIKGRNVTRISMEKAKSSL